MEKEPEKKVHNPEQIYFMRLAKQVQAKSEMLERDFLDLRRKFALKCPELREDSFAPFSMWVFPKLAELQTVLEEVAKKVDSVINALNAPEAPNGESPVQGTQAQEPNPEPGGIRPGPGIPESSHVDG